MFIDTLHSRLNRNSATAQRQRRTGNAKPTQARSKWCRPVLEALEDRTLLACNFGGFGQALENALNALQIPLNNLLAAGSHVPLVGNRLTDQAGLKVFDDPKLDGISERLAAVDTTNGTAVRNALFEILGPGPGGTNLIANLNDLVVTPNLNKCTITVQLPFSKALPNITLGDGFGLGLAGLPFSVTASGGVKVSQVLFKQTAVFTFDGAKNTGAVTGPFNVSATANLIGGSHIDATIGFLKATLKDTGTTATVQFDSQSGVKFDAHVKLFVDATFGDNLQFPSLSANFVLDWKTLNNVNATPQNVRFDNVSVSLGQFVTNLIRPVVEKVQIVTQPLQPIIDFLKEPVPGVSDLAEAAGLGTVTVKDIVELYSKAQAQSDEMNKQIEMYLKLAGIIDAINGIHPDGNAKIEVGNLDLTKNGNTLVNGGILPQKLEGFVKNWEQTLDSLGVTGTQVKDLLKGAEETVRLEFPLIQKPLEGAFKLFLGQHADLVTLDLKYKVDTPAPSGGSIFGIAFGFDGGVKLDAELKLGYDTYGVEKFVKSGKPADLVDGLYLDNATHFTFSSKLGVFAGGGIAVFSVSVSGGLVIPESNPLHLELNMGDPGNQPDRDFTRLHFDEVKANKDCLFHASGKLEASVSITVTIGIKVEKFGVEVFIGYTKEFEIASVTLFDFGASTCLAVGGGGDGQPQLATLDLETGDLTLHMGPKAYKLPVDLEVPPNGNEDFYVTAEGDLLWVIAYGVAQHFPLGRVRKIIADGGPGDDAIVIDESVAVMNASLSGGAGNDHLEFYGNSIDLGAVVGSGRQDVELFGDYGNDVLVGGFGKELLHGGPDKDLLVGGDGDDQLFGEDGNDKLFAGPGDDFVAGGDDNDTIDTGGGHDFGQGGRGEDTFTIHPGVGSPTLYGGAFAVLFLEDNDNDKLIVSGSAGADRFEVTKIDNTATRISRGDARTAGPGYPDNPVAIGFEEIFVEPGQGADQVTVNDLSGTVVTKVVVNQKESFDPDKEADTVIVNGRATSDTVNVSHLYSLLHEGSCDVAAKKNGRCSQDQFATAERVTGIGPEIWTPNAAADNLIVNTLGGNDQVTVTDDPLPSGHSLAPGTVEVNTGDGDDRVFIPSITAVTTVRGGADNDTVVVGALSMIPSGDVVGIRAPLSLEGDSGIDTFRFDDRRSGTGKTGSLATLFPQNAISGFGMGAAILYDTMDHVDAFLGPGGNLLNISNTPAATETQSITVHTGMGDDTVNVKRTNTPVFVDGESGLDTVNVGLLGTVQTIGGLLTVINPDGYSAVNVDNSADPVARTVILYNNGSYNVISGLGSADINLRGADLRSLVIRAGNGGNTFRIHDTPASNTPGGLTTTVSTGAGSDQVTVNGTSGALALDVQDGTNSITVGSTTTGLDRIDGRISVSGLGNLNTLSVLDGASSASHAYVLDRNFVHRLDKARIDYQNLNSLSLQAGTQTDHIIVQDTMPPVGIGSSTSIAQSGGDDRIDVSRTTGILFVFAGGQSVIEVGNATSSLDSIQGGVIVEPSGAGNYVTLILNDQAATTPEQLDVTANALGTRFQRSGAAAINVFFSPLGSFQWFGGSGGNIVNVKAEPAWNVSTFTMGDGGDLLNDGTAANTLVSGSVDSGALTVLGGKGADQLLIRDQGTTRPQRYELYVSPFAGSESRGTIRAQDAAQRILNWHYIAFDQLESVTLNAGSGGNFFKIAGTPAATSVLINTGAGGDTVDVGSYAVNSALADIRGPLLLDGQGGLNQVTFNDQGTTTFQYYNLAADQLTRYDVNGVADMAPISFAAFNAITLNVSSGDSVPAVLGSSAGSTVTVNGSAGGLDVFELNPAFGSYLGPVFLNGQTTDYAYYDEYFNANPQTYLVTTNPALPRNLLLESTNAAPVTFADLSQVVFYLPLVGGSTINIQGVPAQTFLNMAVSNDTVTLGSLAPNLGGTLADIKGPVAVASYSPDGVTLVLDDSGNADLTPKNVVLTPRNGPFDYGTHAEGFAPATVYWNIGSGASVALLGGAADETFSLRSTDLASAISINGGGGVNTLDYSGDGGPTAGLVSWYQGEGSADDAVGSNTGVPVGDVQFVPGKVGQAFSLDGDGDYVQVANAASLEPATVSVEAWVNSTTLEPYGAYGYILSKGAAEYSGASYALVTSINSGLWFYVGNGSAFLYSPDPGAGIWDGNWHHVVGTYDGSYVRLYVDGAEIGNGNRLDNILGYGLPTSNDLFIGTYNGIAGYSFDGLIDEPSIYNRALSAADVQAIYSAGSAGKSGVAFGVVVNLPLGTATGLTGGIANIQNVVGSAGNDILVGNGGNVLSGGLGRDLLLAGALASILNGGEGEDVLIGGTLNDSSQANLDAILAEWSRTDLDYGARVADLRANLLADGTTTSNGGGNTLNGDEGLDLFFGSLDLDTYPLEPGEQFFPA